MIVIGLTGGTGSGKGCVCQKFLKYNISSIDTDKVSRDVCAKGMPCLNELEKIFGSQILNPDNSLNRKKLASIVFSDKEKLNILNLISHKFILNDVRKWLENEKHNGKKAAIVDAPLLYESGFDKECDIIIAVISDIEIRKQRILKRDNLSTEEIKQRLKNQGNDEFYTKKADYVIVNNGSLDNLETQIDTIFTKIFGKEA